MEITPSDLELTINKFHSNLSQLWSCEDYQDGDFVNMDLTPLPFLLDDGKTYEIKDMK